MPALPSVLSGANVGNWIKKKGGSGEPEKILAEIETDRAIMEAKAVKFRILGKTCCKSC